MTNTRIAVQNLHVRRILFIRTGTKKTCSAPTSTICNRSSFDKLLINMQKCFRLSIASYKLHRAHLGCLVATRWVAAGEAKTGLTLPIPLIPIAYKSLIF